MDQNPMLARRRRWRMYFLLILPVALFGGAFIAAREFVNPEYLRASAERFLQAHVHGAVDIKEVDLSWTGDVRLRHVTIREVRHGVGLNQEPFGEAPAIIIPEIRIAENLFSLLRGRLNMESLVLIEPECRLVFDERSRTLNFHRMFRGSADPISNKVLPPIEVRDLAVTIVRRDEAGVEHKVEGLNLTLRGRALSENSEFYDIVWQADREEAGYLQIELATGRARSIRGGAPTVGIGSLMLALGASASNSPELVRSLCLRGRARASDFNWIVDASNAKPFVKFAIEDGAVSVPIYEDERAAGESERYLNFEGVSGNLQLTQTEMIADLEGRLRGASFHVAARARSAVEHPAGIDDLDVTLDAQLHNFTLPRRDEDAPPIERRFIQRWPQVVEFFEHHDPHGTVEASLALRKEAGASLRVEKAHVVAVNGDASFWQHPYRCHGMAGVVDYDATGLWIRNLCGKHGSGVVCVNGRLDRPSRNAPADLEVNASGLAIDDDLYGAVGPEYQAIREQFSPQGNIDAKIKLHRDECAVETITCPFRSSVVIGFDGASARYFRLPYPVTDLRGEVCVENKHLSIKELTGRAGAGTVVFDGEGRVGISPAELDLRIVGRNLETDDQLVTSLPEPAADRVHEFHARGRFDFESQVNVDPVTRDLTQRTVIELAGMSVRHSQYPMPLSDVRGEIEVTGGEIIIRGVTGQHETSTVGAGGVVGLSAEQPLNLAIDAKNLRLDETIRSILPDRVRDALAKWRIDTPIDVELYVRSDGSGMEPAIRGEAHLDADTVSHSIFPEALHNVHAAIVFDGKRTYADKVDATYAGVPLLASFDISTAPDLERGTIKLSAKGLPLDKRTRDLLPARLQATWDNIRPSGRVNVDLEALCFTRSPVRVASLSPESSDGFTETWEASGQLGLIEVSLPELGRMNRINGTISGGGLLRDRLGGTNLWGTFQLDHGEVYDRLVEGGSTPWAFAWTDKGSGRFSLDKFSGRMYGGALSGKTEVRFDNDRASYELSAAVHGMSVGPFINAGRTQGRMPPEKPIDVRGQANANLYLSGQTGAVNSRRGGGRIEIRDGYICKLPLLLAIFNVLNMTMPGDDTIDEAESEFFIVGDTLTIRDLLLKGGGATFAGDGTVFLPDQGVELSLVNGGNSGGLRVPLISNLLEGATRELMEIRVTGTLSQPVARARPLPGVTDEMKRLFQRRRGRPAMPAR